MGAKAARIKRLKEQHPVCFFCATNPTETEDHVPSRECFNGRVAPEGYSFPACGRCNALSSQLEQVVAAYLMMSNYAPDAFEAERFEKLLKGVANNNPDLLPKVGLSAREARRHYRASGLRPPPGFTYSDAPLAALPKGNLDAFEVFARRLTCALYHKEVGCPLPLDYFITSGWIQCIDPRSRELADLSRRLFPEAKLTHRTNTDIGDQFAYRWGYRPAGLFAYTAQFSQSFYFLGGAVSPELHSGGELWRVHREDIPTAK